MSAKDAAIALEHAVLGVENAFPFVRCCSYDLNEEKLRNIHQTDNIDVLNDSFNKLMALNTALSAYNAVGGRDIHHISPVQLTCSLLATRARRHVFERKLEKRLREGPKAASFKREEKLRECVKNYRFQDLDNLSTDHVLHGGNNFGNLRNDEFLQARIPWGPFSRKLPQPREASDGTFRPVVSTLQMNNLAIKDPSTYSIPYQATEQSNDGPQPKSLHTPPATYQDQRRGKFARKVQDEAVSDARRMPIETKNGFQTAKSSYMDLIKKDPSKKKDLAPKRENVPHQHTGGNFVPPYMKKALKSMNADLQGKKEVSKQDQEDGPLSLRTYELLGLVHGQELPEELARIDPMMIEQVCNEVIDSGASVAWEDIAGQESAKRLIQEVVVWPMMNPDIFKGARAPPKGILLFGPPGTGKTLLGKAIASNIDASFFAISASSLTSKWIGDGEKMVKALFAVAGWMAPSVIFIDEIDSLLSARKSDGEHESSRRLKTEILVQMEGCDPASSKRRVLLVGATNRPEELDEAARRRMPKQMYIPLPCCKARRELVLRTLGPGGSVASSLQDDDITKIVKKTDGYSGSDLKNLIQEACQGPIREAVRHAGAKVATLKETDLRPVTLRDFAIAAKAQRASTEPVEIVRYEEYNKKHGATLVDDIGMGVNGTQQDDMGHDEDLADWFN